MERQRAFLDSRRSPPSDSGSATSLNADTVEDFRKKLKHFFMSPCEKVNTQWRISWKLLLQILKIGLVTTQLISFGLSNQMMVTFEDEILVTLRHLLLKGYNDRNIENYAVYTKSEVYDHIHFIVDQYVNLWNLSAGNHAYEKDGGKYTPLSICQDFYRKSLIFPENETFHIDPHVESECSDIYPSQLLADPTIMKKQLNITLDFKRLIRIKIHFALKAINVQTLFHQELPDCYVFAVATTFHNIAQSGRIKMTLNSNTDIKECKDGNVTFTFPRNIHYLTLDSFIILICLTSLLLCVHSLINGILLQFEYTAFFRALRKNVPPWSDRMEFVNGWYILIVLSDSLAISGSLLKIGIHLKNFTSYDVCSILLGTATLLVWTEVIWYLNLFQKYNVLTLALKAAFPNVLRFCGCVIMIYLGYCFCGWIVLGPYHSKWRCLPHLQEHTEIELPGVALQQTVPLLLRFALRLHGFQSLHLAYHRHMQHREAAARPPDGVGTEGVHRLQRPAGFREVHAGQGTGFMLFLQLPSVCHVACKTDLIQKGLVCMWVFAATP
ncbi:mucolipin-3 isoform X2 [Paramormyrops kingsleyae]|uniref:mucolipin-3 isoform X2 n=1 Tax=Paramormyrops kingsleyae TaxID=1676925 RepID=UPI000CD6205F|nr:mucolipin-3-like isoform X2 [Paramormyrops kingsleyae]